MSILSDDVIETILLRLPAFDVVRCKGVCRVWRSLISSADFVAAHLARSKSDPLSHYLLVRNRLFDLRGPVAGTFESLICFSSEDLLDLPRPADGPFSYEDLLIVGSVNGLICIAGKGETPYVTPSPDDIWILNPVTGLSKKLPYSAVSFRTNQNIKFAFWCDDGVYKVAKFLSNRSTQTMLELWVSTSPDTWTVISTFKFHFHFFLHQYHASDVIIEGVAAYWICAHDSRYGNEDHYAIDDELDAEIIVVSLDFKTLAINKFIPQWYTENNGYLWRALDGYPNGHLFGGNFNGEFILVAFRFSADGKYYDAWTPVMDDTGAAIWIKKFTICCDHYPFDGCLRIVNDKLVLTSRDQMVVALCDPLTGIWEVLETTVSKIRAITDDFAHGFVGSLVSINGFGFESSRKNTRSVGKITGKKQRRY